MNVTAALALTGLLLIIATDPKAGSGVQSGPTPATASSTGALKLRVPPICPTGASQDLQCLENAGAVSSSGVVSLKKAKALLQSGTCPCRTNGGTSTGTVPSDTTE